MSIKEWFKQFNARYLENNQKPSAIDCFTKRPKLIAKDHELMTQWLIGQLYQFKGLKKIIPSTVSPHLLVAYLGESAVKVMGYHLRLFGQNDTLSQTFDGKEGYYTFFVSKPFDNQMTITSRPLKTMAIPYSFDASTPEFEFELYYSKYEFDFITDQVISIYRQEERAIDSSTY